MAIITLTTDLGDKDFYQSALKGSILNQLPSVNIVDISHNIALFDIAQAAFTIRNSYKFFPKGTVHVIGVDTGYTSNPKYLALASDGHYFVGPDNGIFSLLFDKDPTKIVEIALKINAETPHFPIKDIFVKAACHLANGGTLDILGKQIPEVNRRGILQPTNDKHYILGSVIYVDAFENVITNISKELFNRIRKNRTFEISFKRKESITSISKLYNDVPEGEKLCLFGLSNYLEIAINKGNAAGLLGLKLGDSVRIEFYDN